MNLEGLKIKGEIFTDLEHQVIYSTDASAYRETPVGVAYPCDEEDIVTLVKYAADNNLNLIPRTAGTSLAGQVVGHGLIVDMSRHINRILEINAEERWVRVQPGIVLDELNIALKPYSLFFSPETSTANRCCIGGMTGNNSCGTHSLVYGSVRDHLLEARTVLSDGSTVLFKPLTPTEVKEKASLSSLEGRIYKYICDLFSKEEIREETVRAFPDAELRRRNSGYALDELLHSDTFEPDNNQKFNFCKVLAGSEGTIGFATELTLSLDPLPPAHKRLICAHCSDDNKVYEANLIALQSEPVAIELIDDKILNLSKDNIEQQKNRFFIKGEPAAIVVIEIAETTPAALDTKTTVIIDSLRKRGLCYDFSVIEQADIARVWNLRKAGLGLLSGMPGSAKPVAVIEDTAVAPYRLGAFVKDIKNMLSTNGLDCVFYGHISTGELHLRPILNLKEEKDRKLFRQVATETALLVKKHRGSLSGEHGDGRLRGEFIPLLLGEKINDIFIEFKNICDPKGILNRGKIVKTPPMDVSLRYEPHELGVRTYFDFSARKGWLCAIEQCNGSGDCRKSNLFGGTMCPSYRATKNENHTTRARANLLRELLIHPTSNKVFSQPEILNVLSTCLSCKGCKSECPSNVDMARYKAEYLQHHYDETGVPLPVRLISNLSLIQKTGMIAPRVYNSLISSSLFGGIIRKMMEFDKRRAIPGIYKYSLRNWLKRNSSEKNYSRKVYLFADEFTDYMDVEIGIAFITLMRKLDYEVIIPDHADSGRVDISKGLLKKAKSLANKNVKLLKDIVSDETPLVGLEPSCILSFRDEYPDLVEEDMKTDAKRLSKNTLLFDEFITREYKCGHITINQFTQKKLNIKLHGHCHQKALVSILPSKEMLSIPANYKVEVIPSGCCGMAGAFGYDRNNYELSMAIGEQVLFPAVRQSDLSTVIAAPGTSCRQQIFDGTGRTAFHPVQILLNAVAH
ncbi:MAG: FAD-binding protein [Muribaculaceae bacterium]|nr:FAD-binding protein [Muribaculaceae bacterium]